MQKKSKVTSLCQTTICSAILHGALDRAGDDWTLLQDWQPSTVWILRKWVQSLDLPPSLVASALIIEPNAHGLHDLVCLMMFLQNFSAIATSYAEPRWWSLTHLWGFSWKHWWRQWCDFKI